jgi:sugar lactone lactonase YvrE
VCVDWLPDGRLLVVSARDGLLLRREHDGSLVTYSDLRTASGPAAVNELVVDGRGNAYVNGGGFDMMAGEEFAAAVIALVAPGGPARQVGDGLAFPHGMLVMPGSSTLIVAESCGKRLTAFDIDAGGGLSNRRVRADLGDGVPDSSCVRVREGGQVLETIDLDRGCFACALGGTSGTTLFVLAQQWDGPQNMFKGPRSGLVLTAQAPAPRAGWP